MASVDPDSKDDRSTAEASAEVSRKHPGQADGAGNGNGSSYVPAEETLTEEERSKALAALERADLLFESTDAGVQSLMIRAYTRTGGVPARIVNAGKGSSPIPDLTSTDAGQSTLKRLDQHVTTSIKALNTREDKRDDT